MKTRRLLAALTVVSGLLRADAPRAESLSLADGFERIDPNVTISVLRENSLLSCPSYCQGFPDAPDTAPAECVLQAGPFSPQTPSAEVPMGVDAEGNAYRMSFKQPIQFGNAQGAFLQRLGRLGDSENVARIFSQICLDAGCSSARTFFVSGSVSFDVTNGRILFPTRARLLVDGIVSDDRVGIVEIGGLPRLPSGRRSPRGGIGPRVPPCPPPSADVASIVLAPSSLSLTSCIDTFILTATALDAHGQPVEGAVIRFIMEAGANSVIGVLTPSSGVSDAGGLVTTMLTLSVGDCLSKCTVNTCDGTLRALTSDGTVSSNPVTIDDQVP
jgi:hypothetical protein